MDLNIEESKAHKTQVTLLRCGCGHCDGAQQELGRLARQYGAVLEVKRVEHEPRYQGFAGWRTPVVFVEGKEVTHFEVNARKWEAAIKKSQADIPCRVIGEIVDVPCYMESKAKGEEHRKCAEECIKKGDPIGLVTRAGDLYLLMEHRSSRGPYARLKDMAGWEVAITGDICERGGVQAVVVKAVEVVS